MWILKLFCLLLSFSQLSFACDVKDCILLSELECALYITDSNERKLNQAFFPPRKATSRYIKVNYDFNLSSESGNGYYEAEQECEVSYLWAVGGFLLIQPPTIFQLTSLLFSYPANDIEEVNLTLPLPCRNLINVNYTTGICSCGRRENNNLDILTQQIMQYSKFNNPDRVVRDVTSTAQAICIEDLVDGYYNHVNVTLYLGTTLVIPVVTGIGSGVIILKYYDFIAKKLTSHQHQPGYVAIIITGFYITLYIIAMDFAAIYYYHLKETNFDEYEHSFSLQLTWITLIAEYATTAVVSLSIFFKYIKRKKIIDRVRCFHFIMRSLVVAVFCSSLAIVPTERVLSNSLFSFLVVPGILLAPALFIFLISFNFITINFLICFIPIPIIFISAHISYVCAAWLTEPSKTTSVAIISLALTFYMFSLNRFLFKCTRDIVMSEKWPSSLEKLQNERCILSVTFLLGFVGVGLAALQIAAFYTLPLPTIRLADYLDNIVNLSLVILAALVSYKILPFSESDFKEFIKEFNKSFVQNAVKEGRQAFRTEMNVATHFSATLSLTEDQVRIDSSNDVRTASVNLENCTLTIQIPRSTSNDSVIVPISNVKLQIAKFQKFQKFVTSYLNEAVLEFTFTSANQEGRSITHSMNLGEAWIKLTEASLSCPTSAIEIQLKISTDINANIKKKELKVFRTFCSDRNETITETVPYGRTSINLSISGVTVKPTNFHDMLGLWCKYFNPVLVQISDAREIKKLNILPPASFTVDIENENVMHSNTSASHIDMEPQDDSTNQNVAKYLLVGENFKFPYSEAVTIESDDKNVFLQCCYELPTESIIIKADSSGYYHSVSDSLTIFTIKIDDFLGTKIELRKEGEQQTTLRLPSGDKQLDNTLSVTFRKNEHTTVAFCTSEPLRESFSLQNQIEMKVLSGTASMSLSLIIKDGVKLLKDSNTLSVKFGSTHDSIINIHPRQNGPSNLKLMVVPPEASEDLCHRILCFPNSCRNDVQRSEVEYAANVFGKLVSRLIASEHV